MAGMKHSVEWWGKGRGVSRIMRRTGQSRGAQNPHTKGGRRAHGPKVEKNWGRKLNLKERRIARNSALSATTSAEYVSARGHRFSEDIDSLPIVLGNYAEVRDGKTEEFSIETFNHGSATRKVLAIFNEIGLGADLTRARDGRNIRAGKATMRGRVHKTPKSVLLVVKQKSGLAQAARNLPGVDVVAARDLCAEDLAPGGDIGRLTVFTKDALEDLN
jgi:large subunit ribosomal protein L4e